MNKARKVALINEAGEILTVYPSCRAAAHSRNLTHNTVARYCNHEVCAETEFKRGYTFRWLDDEDKMRRGPKRKACGQDGAKVAQLSPDGEIMAIFPNMSAAAKACFVSTATVHYHVREKRGSSRLGYYFRKLEDIKSDNQDRIQRP